MRIFIVLMVIIFIISITFLTGTPEKIAISENKNLQGQNAALWLKNPQPVAITNTQNNIILQKQEKDYLIQQVRYSSEKQNPQVIIEWISNEGKEREIRDSWQFDIAAPVYFLGTNQNNY